MLLLCRERVSNGPTSIQPETLKRIGQISLLINLQMGQIQTNGWRSSHKTWMPALQPLKQVSISGYCFVCSSLQPQT